MSGPPVLVTSPTLAYTPKETTTLCEAMKDLLLFMRTQGFRCTHVEVNEKHVLINGLEDDFPASKFHGAREGGGRGTGGIEAEVSYDNPLIPNG